MSPSAFDMGKVSVVQGFRSTDSVDSFCLFVLQGQGVNVPLSTLKTSTLSFLLVRPGSERVSYSFFCAERATDHDPFPFSTCNTWLECVSSTLGFTSHYSPTRRTVSLHWFDFESFGLALRCMVMGYGLLVWGVCVRCFALCSTGVWDSGVGDSALLCFAQLG